MNKEEIFTRWQDPTIEKLQQENQQLKENYNNQIIIANNLNYKNNDLQQRINKVNQIIDECLMLMPHEFSWEEQIENIRKILGGKE